MNGYVLTPNDDGTVTVSGAALEAVDTVLDLALWSHENKAYTPTPLVANKEYRLACWKDGVLTTTPAARQMMADGRIEWGWTNQEEQDRQITKLYRQFVPEVGDTSMCGTYAVQIEQGDVSTDYEPYTEQTLPVTRTLPGIPVASGGNYTDENGQQWICDEVDFGRGVYVQRTLQRTISDFSGAVTAAPGYGHTEGYLNIRVHTRDKTGGYCDKFPYSASGHFPRFGLAGAMIYFTLEGEYTTEEWRERMIALSPAINVALKTPVETALTPEELAAYASLRSNYPNTSVLNDGGAGMAVAYVADTKLYIDKKLAE